jgi:ZIP family zinc transporter
MNQIVAASLASLLAGLATGVGALPALLIKSENERALDAMLGFAGGIMVAAASFGLVVPSLRLGGVWPAVFGFVSGVVFLDFANLIIPHLHPLGVTEGPSSHLRRTWLLILSMVIHNIPEGLAVGVSFGQERAAGGIILAVGIGLQNVPEGLVVAFPLVREGYSRWRAVAYATVTGLAEPVAGVFGITVMTVAAALLPFGLAFAAGAMLYVVFHEMVPESHRRGYEREATLGAMVGFLLMALLDYLFS